MAKRSSARLRSRKSSTPQRVSLSHDAPIRTPRTAPGKLSALHENDEMPGAFPSSVSPAPRDTPTRRSSAVEKHELPAQGKIEDTTPKHATPIKPSSEEMHPKQYQQSTAKPLDEARWLGFSNMAPHTEPPKQASKIATLQGTPTRAPKTLGSPKFEFTFKREFSLELSPDAKKLMNEKRDEAAKIREQMIAEGEGFQDVTGGAARKIAVPKGKKGRFSDAHMAQFNKMDSIAGHASAFRADPNKAKPLDNVIQTHTEGQKAQQAVHSPTKSLKRSPSKAKLDDSDDATQGAAQRMASKPTSAQPATHLPHSTSSKSLRSRASEESSSPAKRVKRAEADDVSTTRPPPDNIRVSQPSTPRPNKTPTKKPAQADNFSFHSPTQASLARTSSVKSVKYSKIPGPSLSQSPSKSTLQETNKDSPKVSTPLLARSPSKAALFSYPSIEKPKAMMSPLLMRTPAKGATIKKVADNEEQTEKKVKEAPLLSRSPLKMSVAKNPESNASESNASSSIPFLSRSPAKIAMPKSDADAPPGQTPGKSPGSNLMGRFNLLRSSPMKSILRSPQRLYSTDPAKVAAGTHLASPADIKAAKNKPLPEPPTTCTPPEKHVDFTSSTKKRHERDESEASSTPSKGPTPPPKTNDEIKPSPKPTFADYPQLPTDEAEPLATPQKRRQTAAPGDFTFTAHGHGIIFSQSPNAPVSAAKTSLPATIRHVSAEPQFPPAPAPAPAPATGSKKRKFEFENEQVVHEEATAGGMSDKENAGAAEGEERPAKRVKPSAPESAPAGKKPATRLPTLGVKPKKTASEGREKKPGVISKARLNALAQPKRRG